jgi:protein gp37
MADNSKIEWTDATWNPVRGCSVVSEGCRNCYAMAVAARFSGPGMAYEGLAYRNGSGPHWTGETRLIQEHLEDPIRWKAPRRIFVNSMSDLFHESLTETQIQNVFSVMESARRHVFQVLTKRPQRMFDFVKKFDGWLKYASDYPGQLSFAERFAHVWLGVSVEDQKTADERIPLLLQTPAAVRWISAEPLLGPVDLFTLDGEYKDDDESNRRVFCRLIDGVDWIVVGGESGPNARPMHPDWARSLRDQCETAGVPFFFKQWGQLEPVGLVRDGDEVINGTAVYDQEGERILPDCCSNDYEVDPEQVAVRFKSAGKKAAGRLLDGREWSEYPKAKAAV